MSTRYLTLAIATVAGLGAHAVRADLLPFYVGVDDLPTIATGTYAGLANPNFNRLTFLLAHTYPETPASNHYHSKGVQVYTGPNLGAATTVGTSASNFVPESGNAPIALRDGTGLYTGKLASNTYAPSDPLYHTAAMTVGNTRSLNGFAAGSGETVLFNSSAGRWNSAFDAADVHWELISLTPGLHVGTAATLNVVTQPGDEVHLGDGDESFAFTPVLWTDATAAAGTYEARFRLTDESGTFGDSGDLRIVTSVPEPATLALAGCAAVGLMGRRRA